MVTLSDAQKLPFCGLSGAKMHPAALIFLKILRVKSQEGGSYRTYLCMGINPAGTGAPRLSERWRSHCLNFMKQPLTYNNVSFAGLKKR
jgi:hypothetical protein